ncbi:MAG: hypothetical protein HZC55_00725 [Verrucomicrobia bacterium]|jgi:hypothetical protein|nr:hypothetical protein [Verrucomicrobiota bacterium]
MITHLLHLVYGRAPTPEAIQYAFVQEVHVDHAPRREPRVERLILTCWLLIAAKHGFILWACRHYPIPFHSLWINFPTWLLGTLATGIYYGRLWQRA